jgi:5-methylcytosine-specific restriction endonuclease McrA
MADLKVCRKCAAEKPLSDFHRDKNRADGHYCYCKPCTIRDAQEWAADPERKALKREYDRRRVARLRDKLSAQNKANYQRKREQKIAAAKRWAEANPSRVRLYKQNNKHLRRAVERDGLSWSQLRDWKASQPKACHWCGKSCAKSYVVDHIQPLAKGGKHEAHNLAISCRSCNARKSAKDPIEFAQSIGKLL